MARDHGVYSASRRGFCLTFAGVVIAPGIALAQGATRVRRIGVLLPGDGPPPDKEEIQEVLKPLRQLGWIEDRNIVFEPRFTRVREDRVDAAAEELVRRKVDLILTYGTPPHWLPGTQRRRSPLLFLQQPIPSAWDLSRASHPGGNITGYSGTGPEMDARRARLVHELLPTARRVAVFVPPKGATSIGDASRETIGAAYRSLGLQPIFIDVLDSTNEMALAEAVREAVRQQAQALEIGLIGKGKVVEAALGYRLPVILLSNDWGMLEAGGLLFLVANEEDRYRRVAVMIDKILRGAKPADIPVEQPTRYTLVINLRTAKALGITVPRSLLLQADEVIR